jgi:hypothetical protein
MEVTSRLSTAAPANPTAAVEQSQPLSIGADDTTAAPGDIDTWQLVRADIGTQ